MPYRDYLVSGDWVMNLLQQRKIAFGDARAELIKVGKNLPRLLQNLDKMGTRRRTDFVARATWSGCIEIELVEKAVPFRKVPAVEAWLAQYQHDFFRYRFLVLEGLSGLGKTQFSVSLSPRSLEVTL